LFGEQFDATLLRSAALAATCVSLFDTGRLTLFNVRTGVDCSDVLCAENR